MTKYLTKGVAEAYCDAEQFDPDYEAHVDRLHEEVRWLPCSPQCANWLRYGVEPRDPSPGLVPGACVAPAHDRDNLGLGGRRVQVSRHWSGKTLAEHRADRAAVVREVLATAGVEAPDRERRSVSVLARDGRPRFVWQDSPIDAEGYAHAVARWVSEQVAWRQEYDRVKQHAARAGPPRACGHPFGNQTAKGQWVA